MAINVITNLKILLLILALCALLFLSNTQATTELYKKCEKDFWYKNQKDFKKSIKSECLKEKRHHEKRHRKYHSCNDKSYDKSVIVSRWEKFSDCRCEAALAEMGNHSKEVFVCYQIAQYNKATGEFTAELTINKKKKNSYDVTVEYSYNVEVMNDDGDYGVIYRTEKIPSDDMKEKYYISGKISKSESMNKVTVDRISPIELKLTVNDGKSKNLKKYNDYAIMPFPDFVLSNKFLPSGNNDLTDTPPTSPTSPTEDPKSPKSPTSPTSPKSSTGPTGPNPEGPTGPTGPTSPADSTDPKVPTSPPTDAGPDPKVPTSPPGPTDPNGPTSPPTDTGPAPNGPASPPNDPTDPTDPTNPTNPTGPTGPTGPSDSTDPTNPNDPAGPNDTDPTDTSESTDPDSKTPPGPGTGPTPAAAASLQTPEAKQEEANQPSSGVSTAAVGSIVFGVILAIGGVFVGWNTYERLRWRRQYRRRQEAAQQNPSLANVPDYNGYGRAY